MASTTPPYKFSKQDTKVKRFWDELEKNHLVTTQCQNCKSLHWPPKSFCNKCYSDNIDFVDLPSTGTLITWTKVTAPPEGFPKEGYSVGIVKLRDTKLKVFGKIASTDKILKTNAPVKLEVLEDASKFRYFQFLIAE
jgi:uncharacterized OB-fold protein